MLFKIKCVVHRPATPELRDEKPGWYEKMDFMNGKEGELEIWVYPNQSIKLILGRYIKVRSTWPEIYNGHNNFALLPKWIEVIDCGGVDPEVLTQAGFVVKPPPTQGPITLTNLHLLGEPHGD